MSWLVLIVIHPPCARFSGRGFRGLDLMTAGGLPYTIGALFYIAE